MIGISEWLPNPVGNDRDGEWVELQNTGNGPVNLAGWFFQNSSGKRYLVKEAIVPPGGYRVLGRGERGLVLRNNSEHISLYDAKGVLISESSFFGTAPEGKSVNVHGASYTFGKPTPGAQNTLPMEASIERTTPRVPAPTLHQNPVLLALGTATIITLFVMLLVKCDPSLHKLFFGRD